MSPPTATACAPWWPWRRRPASSSTTEPGRNPTTEPEPTEPEPTEPEPTEPEPTEPEPTEPEPTESEPTGPEGYELGESATEVESARLPRTSREADIPPVGSGSCTAARVTTTGPIRAGGTP
ncbi:hypothetical protein Cs7R123_19630 [Catellatospora sp. TT07R-123]|nr:hypothetical protein Cs7R123_19630 [Catellatospora sp. TT07R-123]